MACYFYNPWGLCKGLRLTVLKGEIKYYLNESFLKVVSTKKKNLSYKQYLATILKFLQRLVKYLFVYIKNMYKGKYLGFERK